MATLDYILSEMTSSEGASFATDADSEGVEESLFCVDAEEVRARRLTATRRLAGSAPRHDVTAAGNWEHKNVPPHGTQSGGGRERPGAVHELRQTINSGQTEALRRARASHPARLDDKVITAWNGMMISAMKRRRAVYSTGPASRGGATGLRFSVDHALQTDGRLLRTYRAGTAHLDAYLKTMPISPKV
ncbi:MAG: hypothetical protein MRJ92_10410 [Nitrospira sp.]|nr:hypothetical protein [Nitrospira sp.]